MIDTHLDRTLKCTTSMTVITSDDDANDQNKNNQQHRSRSLVDQFS